MCDHKNADNVVNGLMDMLDKTNELTRLFHSAGDRLGSGPAFDYRLWLMILSNTMILHQVTLAVWLLETVGSSLLRA